MKRKTRQTDSFRTQMAQSMGELESIMKRGESFDGNGRFTARNIRVEEPRSYTSAGVRAVRQKLGVSQAIFAQMLGVSLVLVRSWERGVRTPAPIACRLLDIVQKTPQVLANLTHAHHAAANDHGKQSHLKRRRASAA